MKKFLKRFEKLENKPVDYPVDKAGLTVTRRFECLEINDKKISLSIHDAVANEERAPSGTQYYRMCPYCGAENNADADSCWQCKHDIKGQFYSDYGGRENLLKKCVCGAVNLKERKCCWVCGRDFTLWGDGQEVKKQQENLIVLTIDGKTYRSDDSDLPPGIVALMEKIRRQGYSKELIDEWMQQTNEEKELRREEVEQRIGQLRWDMLLRLGGVIAIGLFIFLRIYFAVHR